MLRALSDVMSTHGSLRAVCRSSGERMLNLSAQARSRTLRYTSSFSSSTLRSSSASDHDARSDNSEQHSQDDQHPKRILSTPTAEQQLLQQAELKRFLQKQEAALYSTFFESSSSATSSSVSRAGHEKLKQKSYHDRGEEEDEFNAHMPPPEHPHYHHDHKNRAAVHDVAEAEHIMTDLLHKVKNQQPTLTSRFSEEYFVPEWRKQADADAAQLVSSSQVPARSIPSNVVGAVSAHAAPHTPSHRSSIHPGASPHRPEGRLQTAQSRSVQLYDELSPHPQRRPITNRRSRRLLEYERRELERRELELRQQQKQRNSHEHQHEHKHEHQHRADAANSTCSLDNSALENNSDHEYRHNHNHHEHDCHNDDDDRANVSDSDVYRRHNDEAAGHAADTAFHADPSSVHSDRRHSTRGGHYKGRSHLRKHSNYTHPQQHQQRQGAERSAHHRSHHPQDASSASPQSELGASEDSDPAVPPRFSKLRVFNTLHRFANAEHHESAKGGSFPYHVYREKSSDSDRILPFPADLDYYVNESHQAEQYKESAAAAQHAVVDHPLLRVTHASRSFESQLAFDDLKRGAVTLDELRLLLLPLEPPRHLVAAVSGGPDSMGMLFLLEQFCKATDRNLSVVSIDHGLRSTSADDVKMVRQYCAKRDIPFRAFAIDLTKAKERLSPGKLQQLCRQERYKVLVGVTSLHPNSAVVLGHQREDQVETFLHRLAMSSTTIGLGSMEPATPIANEYGSSVLLRPLLPVPRARLLQTCEENNIPYLIDVSNSSKAFVRSRKRVALSQYDAANELNKNVMLLSDHCREFRWDMTFTTNCFLQQQCHVDTRGFAMFDSDEFRALPMVEARSVIRELLMHIGARSMPPASKSMRSVVEDLRENYKEFSPRTVGGCVVMRKFTDRWNVVITRETPTKLKNSRIPIEWDVPLHWDSRFVITVTRSQPKPGSPSLEDDVPPQKLFVGPLSDTLYAELRRKYREEHPPFPLYARRGAPVIFDENDNVVALPSLLWRPINPYVHASSMFRSNTPLARVLNCNNPRRLLALRVRQLEEESLAAQVESETLSI